MNSKEVKWAEQTCAALAMAKKSRSSQKLLSQEVEVPRLKEEKKLFHRKLTILTIRELTMTLAD